MLSRRDAGIHPKVARERLGHGTVSTTLDLCSHVTDASQQDAATRLDAALGSAIRGASGSTGGVREQTR